MDSSNNTIIIEPFNGNLYLQFYEWSGDTSLVKTYTSSNEPVHRLNLQISQDDTMNMVLNTIGLSINNITDINYPSVGLIYSQPGTNSILRLNTISGLVYDDSENSANLDRPLSVLGLLGDATIEIYAINLH
jgi:hypothetical protein